MDLPRDVSNNLCILVTETWCVDRVSRKIVCPAWQIFFFLQERCIKISSIGTKSRTLPASELPCYSSSHCFAAPRGATITGYLFAWFEHIYNWNHSLLFSCLAALSQYASEVDLGSGLELQCGFSWMYNVTTVVNGPQAPVHPAGDRTSVICKLRLKPIS